MTGWPTEFREYERVASVAQVGGFRPPTTPRTSWLGQVLLGRPGETWPVHEGRPLWGVCQIRVDELPMRAPSALDGVELVTIFLDLIDLPLDAPNGEGWELRTYESVDELVPLLEPERDPEEDADFSPRPFPVIWRARVDLPSRDDAPTDDYRAFLDGAEDLEPAAMGLKVGGWPYTVQAELSWGRDVEFAIQVDSDEKSGVMIGDAGLCYFGRSPSGDWVMDWQCY